MYSEIDSIGDEVLSDYGDHDEDDFDSNTSSRSSDEVETDGVLFRELIAHEADAELQMALAISKSLQEQEERDCGTKKESTVFGINRLHVGHQTDKIPSRNKKAKRNCEVSALVIQSEEERLKLISKNIATLTETHESHSEESMHVLNILWGKSRNASATATISRKKEEDYLWHLSTSGIKKPNSSFYIPCLQELLSPSKMLKKELHEEALASEEQESTVKDTENLSEDLRQFVGNSSFSDVNIHIKDEILFAHKVILAARSSVLAKELQACDKSENITHLDWNHVSKDTALSFLCYMYSGYFPGTSNIQEILSLAERYKVVYLVKHLQRLKKDCDIYNEEIKYETQKVDSDDDEMNEVFHFICSQKPDFCEDLPSNDENFDQYSRDEDKMSINGSNKSCDDLPDEKESSKNVQTLQDKHFNRLTDSSIPGEKNIVQEDYLLTSPTTNVNRLTDSSIHGEKNIVQEDYLLTSPTTSEREMKKEMGDPYILMASFDAEDSQDTSSSNCILAEFSDSEDSSGSLQERGLHSLHSNEDGIIKQTPLIKSKRYSSVQPDQNSFQLYNEIPKKEDSIHLCIKKHETVQSSQFATQSNTLVLKTNHSVHDTSASDFTHNSTFFSQKKHSYQTRKQSENHMEQDTSHSVTRRLSASQPVQDTDCFEIEQCTVIQPAKYLTFLEMEGNETHSLPCDVSCEPINGQRKKLIVEDLSLSSTGTQRRLQSLEEPYIFPTKKCVENQKDDLSTFFPTECARKHPTKELTFSHSRRQNKTVQNFDISQTSKHKIKEIMNVTPHSEALQSQHETTEIFITEGISDENVAYRNTSLSESDSCHYELDEEMPYHTSGTCLTKTEYLSQQCSFNDSNLTKNTNINTQENKLNILSKNINSSKLFNEDNIEENQSNPYSPRTSPLSVPRRVKLSTAISTNFTGHQNEDEKQTSDIVGHFCWNNEDNVINSPFNRFWDDGFTETVDLNSTVIKQQQTNNGVTMDVTPSAPTTENLPFEQITGNSFVDTNCIKNINTPLSHFNRYYPICDGVSPEVVKYCHKGSKNSRINQEVTPLPDYEKMTRSEIRRELNKIGVKSLPKKQAIALLFDVYEQTHPWETDNEEEHAKKDFSNQIATHGEKKNIADCRVSSLKHNTEKRSCPAEYNSQVLTETQQNEHSCWQNNLLKYFRENTTLLEKLLMYQPINLTELLNDIRSQKIKISSRNLINFLDEKCITFTTPRKKRCTQKQQKRAKVFKPG
ncbi:uncharacterized protein LOC106464074 [Limulus polyphemus]|uniref:Structure-specific endonuclease subunit SLX4 n=1 Tax=Limulus polyphemus TaxID=6850 RepID=A0ABM1BD84_LIMPO|nr:uncharacterized protein LOC106464074 [Limulus polyphemus]